MSDWRSNKPLFQFSITILILLDISAIILNGLVAYVLKRHKKTRIITFWFIYCLSISDVMVGLIHLLHHLILFKLFSQRGKTTLDTLNTVLLRFMDYLLSMSGRLILIIAVDRCIHMKYLTKYTTIMTQFRARLIVFLNTIFGIFLLIPVLLPQQKYSDGFYFGVNTFHTAGTVMIYVIYIKSYFSVKKQVAALHTINTKDSVVQNTPGSSKPSTPHLCRDSMRINSAKDCRTCNNCLAKKDNVILKSQQKAYVLPKSAGLCPHNIDHRFESPIGRGNNAQYLADVEPLVVIPVNDIKMENKQPMERRKPNKEQNLEGDGARMQQRRQLKTDREFRKTTLLILLALFICYVPYLIKTFYSLAGGHSIVFSYISAITLLLNSSLNAIILIVCSREIKGNVKAIFEQCWAWTFPQQNTNRAT